MCETDSQNSKLVMDEEYFNLVKTIYQFLFIIKYALMTYLIYIKLKIFNHREKFLADDAIIKPFFCALEF